MGALFANGKATTLKNPIGWLQNGGTDSPITVPTAPTVANSQGALDVAAEEQAQALQRGRSATILTSGAGLSNVGATSKTLLGQ